MRYQVGLSVDIFITDYFFKARDETIFKFDKIIGAVLQDEADIGLLIPGPALTSAYEKFNLIKVADIMEEWKKKAGDIPMPMGSYVLKKKYSIEEAMEVRKTFQESIDYARNHPEKAFAYAMNYAEGAEQSALKYLYLFSFDSTIFVP